MTSVKRIFSCLTVLLACACVYLGISVDNVNANTLFSNSTSLSNASTDSLLYLYDGKTLLASLDGNDAINAHYSHRSHSSHSSHSSHTSHTSASMPW